MAGAEVGTGNHLDWRIGFHLVCGGNSSRGSFERFQTGHKGFGKYWLVGGVEPVGQAGVTVGEDRPGVCTLEGPLKHRLLGNSLSVQRLRLCTSTSGGMGWIPGQGSSTC